LPKQNIKSFNSSKENLKKYKYLSHSAFSMAFLVNIRLEHILQNQKFEFCREEQTISDAIGILAKKDIGAVPVIDANGVPKGSLDLLDLVAYCIEKLDLKNEKTQKSDKTQIQDFMNRPIKNLEDFSRQNPFICLPPRKSLRRACLLLGYPRCHRIWIGDKGSILGVMTQLQAMELIWKQKNEIKEMMNFRLRDLFPESRQPITISIKDTLMNAFWMIWKSRVSGIGIVDEKGMLVGNVSATDLKFLAMQNNPSVMLEALKNPLSHFLANKKGEFPKDPVVVSLDESMENVMNRFIQNRVHRVYVVDQQMKPIEVLSASDILAQFGYYDVLKGTRA